MAQKKIIRIGYLMHGIFYGGASRSLIFLLKSLETTTNFEFFIYTTSCSSDIVKKEFESLVSNIRFVKVSQITVNQATQTSLREYKRNKQQGVPEFINQLISDNIDILHVNTTVFSHVLSQVKYHTNIKIITHIRELIPPKGNGEISDYIIDQIYQHSDHIICISDNEEKSFLHFMNRAVIPNPVDFAAIAKIKDNRALLGIEKSIDIVSMSSHFYRPKGHLVFLKAINEIVNKKGYQNIRFLIIGYKEGKNFWFRIARRLIPFGNYRREIKKYIQHNNLESFVSLIPYTYEIFPFIKASDIIVRPSLSADPWGRDIIEAMALKKPVIATGTSEFYVVNNVTGLLIQPNDPFMLAETIVELLNDSTKRKFLGQNAYKKVKTMCDIEGYSAKLKNLYRNLIYAYVPK